MLEPAIPPTRGFHYDEARLALATATATGLEREVNAALGNLLLALLAQGALADARRTLGEFVAVARQLGFMFLMYTADAMALLAARERRWAAAVRLLGYADAGYAEQGQPREPNEASAREATWALLRDHCAKQDVEAWLAAGAALEPDAVCALALELSAT